MLQLERLAVLELRDVVDISTIAQNALVLYDLRIYIIFPELPIETH